MRKELLAVASAMVLAVASGSALADANGNGNDQDNDSGVIGAFNTTNSFNTTTNTSTNVSVGDIGVAVSANTLTQTATQVNAQVNAAGLAGFQINAMSSGDLDAGSDNSIVGSGISSNTGFNSLQGSQSAFSTAVGDN